MIRYLVTAQDARGNRVEIDVRAGTDEQACARVLCELNSWKAIGALPAGGHQPCDRVLKEPEATSPAALALAPTVGTASGSLSTPEREPGPRVIRQTTVTEWIHDSGGHGQKLGPLGRALLAAAKELGETVEGHPC